MKPAAVPVPKTESVVVGMAVSIPSVDAVPPAGTYFQRTYDFVGAPPVNLHLKSAAADVSKNILPRMAYFVLAAIVKIR